MGNSHKILVTAIVVGIAAFVTPGFLLIIYRFNFSSGSMLYWTI